MDLSLLKKYVLELEPSRERAFLPAELFRGLHDYGESRVTEWVLDLLDGSFSGIVFALEARDEYSSRHSERVSIMARRFGETVGAGKSAVKRLEITAKVHDIGKIGVPDAVLLAPRRLTEEEFAVMRSHTVLGYELITKTTCTQKSLLEDLPRLRAPAPVLSPDFMLDSFDDQMADIAAGIRNHHERWDGKGYPDGLKGMEIPYSARMIALCDSTDAMMSNRVYRRSIGAEKCLAEIEKNSGVMYDPVLADLFLHNWEQITQGLFEEEPQ